LTRRISRQKYNEIFEGINSVTKEQCIIKIFNSTEKKIKREIKILQNLSGATNVIQLLDVVCDSQNKTPRLILEYMEYCDFRNLYPTFTNCDIRYYIYELLKALECFHSKGIMHRDIKPDNVFIDHNRRKLKVTNWDLAEFYHTGHEYNVRLSSRYCKAPELLTDMKCYDYSLDLWNVGCMFAGMIFRKEPFFSGRDNFDQLVKIAKVLGTEKLYQYLDKYNLELNSHFNGLLPRNKYPVKSWDKFINSGNQHLIDPLAIDLLDKLLRYDHKERLTAKEAMEHAYFAPIREQQAQNTLE
jgi:casein kinase II subunit alpha